MASASSGPVDPTKPGRYPVVLGDSILNRSNPTEILTGIRYNHKPTLSTPSAPTHANIIASSQQTPGAAQAFELTFNDGGGKYTYSGQRTTDPGQVVLIFDPAQQVFRLERVNSLFHMNLAATPSNEDAESLRQEFPHLEISKSAVPVKVDGPAPKKGGRKATEKKPTAKKPRKQTASAKEEKKPAPKSKPVDISLPAPPPPQQPVASPKPKKPQESDEDEDSDDELGIEVEYPGGKPADTSFAASVSTYEPTPFEKFLQGHDDHDEEDADADFEFESEGDEDKQSVVSDAVKLPSPVGRPPPAQNQQYYAQEEGSEEDEDGGGLEDALEAELEAALDEEVADEDSEDVSEEE